LKDNSDAPRSYTAALTMRAIGPYEIVEKLGEGGMAEVYLAVRRRDGGFVQKVALKRIHPRYQGDAVLRERFMTEARTNARLRHSNIVDAIDFGTSPEPFLALEYVDGVTVGELMFRMYQLRQRFDVSAAMFIAIGVAQALDYAHKLRGDDGTPLGIVHRDVSPANVLLSMDGTPYVMDFGLVQVADNLLERYGAATVGTFCYMAPEQLAGGLVDGRADIFSLGVLLWEMLTTRRLISSNDPREVHAFHEKGELDSPTRLNPEVPADVAELTLQCLRPNPDDRPPSAAGVSVALQRMAHERAPGYGREQLAKTVRWAFPEREWSHEPPNLPAEQPEPADRARLAREEKEKDQAHTARLEALRTGQTLVSLAVTAALVTVSTVVAFALGLIVGLVW
jgi:serine/threonine protein kinase